MAGFKAWLESHALADYHRQLTENAIDFEIVTELAEADLIELGIPLGDRKRLLRAIRTLQAERQREAGAMSEAPAAFFRQTPISADSDDSESERRLLTMMFVDLVGSTKLSSELGLEEYRAVLHDYQTCCLEAIRSNQGHIAQFIGDGVVACFGYPVGEENDAERAVIAALDICNAMTRLTLDDGRALEVRVGLSSGDVVVDEHTRMGGLVIGEVPNLAARVQSIAEPGTVAISDTTKQLLGDNFACVSQGRHKLKGFETPVGIWRVSGVDATEMRFRSRHFGPITPLVNRDAELSLLFGRLSDAIKGRGHAVMMSGEAGIGKSRIVEALSDGTEEAQCLRLNFQCSPNHESSAYFPLISFMNHMSGIVRADGPEQKLSKLRQLLANWTEDDAETVALYANLMSIPLPSDRTFKPLSAEQQKERLHEVLVNTVLMLASRQPVLVLFEDLHWIDPSTEEIIGMLIDRLRQARVLIICTYRPGYDPPWCALPHVTTVSIARLHYEDTLKMLSNLLPSGRVPPEMEEQIARKTDGVPLFLEEMARMVSDRANLPGPIAQEDDILTLPSTLKELLRAMIDKLASARAIVPVCAAIGRTIFPKMIEAVTGQTAQTTQLLLDQLVDAQILLPKGNGQDRSYTFRHALIQDAAYELMLPSRARTMHRRIAQVIETGFHDLAQANPEVLAQHYSRADMPREARDAWQRAADQASSRSANEETIQHLNAALRDNAKLESEIDRTRGEIALRKSLNIALDARAFGSKETLENLSRLHDLLENSEVDHADAFLALHAQFGAKLMASDPASALPLCRDMEIVASRAEDPTMDALIAHNQAMGVFMLGHLDDAIAAFDKALRLRASCSVENVLNYHAADIRMVDMAMRCWALALKAGDTKPVRDELMKAEVQARAEPHEFSSCFALSILATAFQILGDRQKLLDLADAALVISKKRRFHYWDAWNAIQRGWARARGTDPERGLDELKGGIEDYLQTGSTQITLYAQTLLADAYLASGDVTAGLAVIREVRQGEKDSTVRYQVPITDRVETALLKAAK